MFKIIDNVLQVNEAVYCINKPNDKIAVIGEIPISARVYCSIVGLETIYKFPLVFKECTVEGNIFECYVLLDDATVNYIKHNPDIDYKFFITINGTIIENTQRIAFNNKLISNMRGSIENIVYEIANLKADLLAYKCNNIVPNPMMRKGMVPVATGVGEEYNWDYPFGNINKKLEQISDLLVKLSASNVELCNRVEKVEKQVLEHIYESYNI